MTNWQDLEFLSSSNICQRCMGRIFAKVGHGLSNPERGEKVVFALNALGLHPSISDEQVCSICKGIFLNLRNLCAPVEDALKHYEFSSFLIGSENSVPSELEKDLESRFGQGEGLKKEFNREFGKLLSNRMHKEASQKDPDVIITVNLEYLSFRFWFKSLFIQGRYRKLVRGIPQTRWIIHDRNDSVEEVIGLPAKNMVGAENFFLHAAGREDVDVLMLGKGREFVLELSSPRSRTIDLVELARQVNASGSVEIEDLQVVGKEQVERVKSSRNDKTYLAHIESERDIDPERFHRAVSELSGKIIYQRTPLRVSGRRADLVRERVVKKATTLSVDGSHAVVEITAEAGTYIKELVNGDEGRTNPSLSGLYGSSLKVEKLDVLAIEEET
ncbi:MAG: tRNA pseudouridine(54/55) synthase Pus10 [Candidatus Thermoplasmatota archaeon]|nr:tRNA pseudouridine(54/55) synthase Pus10 [Candidatus Thermoplasmatota archaeon]